MSVGARSRVRGALVCLAGGVAVVATGACTDPGRAQLAQRSSSEVVKDDVTTTPGGPAKPVKLPGRCMRETPAEPARETPPPAATCPPDEGEVPTLDRAVVEFEGSDARVGVELAKAHEHRMRGLMYRTSMPEDEGMLFVFEDERPLSFWMRNTCIPLDMLFIAADGVIVNIEENTPTLTDQNFGSAGCKARYVLEVNAGWARKKGIRAGMRVKLP